MSLRTGSCTGERHSDMGLQGLCIDSGDLFNQMAQRHHRFYVLFALPSASLRMNPTLYRIFSFFLTGHKFDQALS